MTDTENNTPTTNNKYLLNTKQSGEALELLTKLALFSPKIVNNSSANFPEGSLKILYTER